MTFLIIMSLLLVANIAFGIRDVKNGATTKSAAFTWFVVGWVTLDVITELGKVLGG